MSEEKSSRSEPKPKSQSKSRSPEKDTKGKVFITNLDSKIREPVLQEELRKHCQQYGPIKSLVVKKSPHSDYSFAFLDFQNEQSGLQAVKQMQDFTINGRKIKIEFQSDTRRRKDRNEGCYNCGRFGHFARQCHQKRDHGDRRSRDRKRRSRSRDKHDKKHRSRSHRRQKKHRSRERSNDSRPRQKDRYRRDRSRSRRRSDS